MTHDEINSALIKLWKKHFPKPHYKDVFVPMRRFFLRNEPQPEKSVAFVGLNPSFIEDAMRGLFANIGHPEIEPREFFRWPINMKIYDAEIDQEFEAKAFESYPYFKQIRLFSRIYPNIIYLDIFALRETNQKIFREKTILGDSNLNYFGQYQFKLFWNRIEIIKPRTIVVINAKASHIYEEQRRGTIIYDIEKGYHLDSIEGQQVPVFFAGMLSGQRAMDIWSRHRLFWQVAKLLGKPYDPAAMRKE